jgi:hypothetical protein
MMRDIRRYARRFPKANSAAEAVGILTALLALPGLRVLAMPAGGTGCKC